MIVLRNIAFYLVFYLGSIVVTSAALLSIPFGWEVFRRRVSNWSGLQRWCVVNLLGVELKIEGAPLDEPVLYAVKHESFFEAIDESCYERLLRSDNRKVDLMGLCRADQGVDIVRRNRQVFDTRLC